MDTHAIWLSVKEGDTRLLENPVAEVVRQIVVATLETVRLYERGRVVTPDAFSFIGIQEGCSYPIWQSKPVTGDSAVGRCGDDC